MAAQTLSRVTLQTLHNYTTAAQRTVAATRLGGHRIVGVVDGALKTRVYARTVKVLLDEMRDGVTGFVTKGIDRLAQRTEKAIETGATVAAEQVTRAARLASTVENPIVANGLQTAARLTSAGAGGRCASGAPRGAPGCGRHEAQDGAGRTACAARDEGRDDARASQRHQCGRGGAAGHRPREAHRACREEPGVAGRGRLTGGAGRASIASKGRASARPFAVQRRSWTARADDETR